MSAGGGSQSTSTEPWAGLKPSLQALYRDANRNLRLKDTPDQYGELSGDERRAYVDQTTGIDARDAGQLSSLGLDPSATQTAIESGGFVPFTSAEQEAQQGALDLARSGVDPYLTRAQSDLASNAGLGYLDEGASGAFLTPDSNPYLAGAVKAAQDPLIERFQTDILPSVTGQFGSSGRFGSGAHQYAVERATDDFTQNLADAATNAYANAYQTERGNQLAAQQALTQGVQRNAALSPTLANAVRQQEVANLGLLEGVGGAQASKAAELGLMQADDFDARANDEVNRLERFAAMIQGTPALPNQVTQTGNNRAAGALGGATTGAALGSIVPGVGPGVGMAGGAILGGLGGLFL